MSKDIWHKPIETTDVDNNLIIDDWTNRTYELGYFDDKDMIFRNLRNDDTYFEESMMRWCDVNELIDDYDRTRKALDVAVDALKDNLSQANFTQMLDASRFHCIRTKCEFALEQITAILENKNGNC